MNNNSSNHLQEDYELHKLVFNNDISGVSRYLNHHKINDFEKLKDHQGNTPLHLAVMLGHKECVQILLKHEHNVLVKNLSGWTVLQEAVSYGDRQTITSLLRAVRKEKKKSRANQKPEIKRAMDSFGGDFYMEMTWDFQSWLPFVSRMLPSDICHIYRSGNRIRMDSTLEDFSDRRWIHGDITYIINFESEGDPVMLLLDNKRKLYEKMKPPSQQEKEASIEDEVDMAMSSDIVDGSMKTKGMAINRMASGWIFRHDKTEKVGRFEADFYKLSGLVLATRKRREHLSDEDLKKNKLLRDAFSHGEVPESILEDENKEPDRRKSLTPPEGNKISWNEYKVSIPGSCPCLGRKLKEKCNNKTFEATLGISTDFPIKLENLLPILEALGPKAKVFAKLRDFVTVHLPPGFPVRIDIPIFPTIKAMVTFPAFEFRADLSESLFSVPVDYVEMPGWFEKSNKTRQKESSKMN